MNSSSLGVGDVVSAGLRIYRDRFKTYFPLAIIAGLWSIVPIYGWAKYGQATGLISRLAFGEIIEKPESVYEARNRVQPRLWTFFLASLLISLIVFGVLFVSFLVVGILTAIATGTNTPALFLIIVPLLIGIFILFFWFFTRLSLVELMISIEDISEPTRAIGRSWQLTKQFVGRLALIYFIAGLISLPISFASNFILGIFQVILEGIFGADSDIFQLLESLISLAINLLSIGIMMPFWQSIKAAIYYDLRSQREGIDLM
ncbi:MAG: hypothetical protein EA365_01505 [Gloeocapsa sp. DLM2.Bin57]|nr:MAG: hypothetical protein EA365_01505 [Gloeocapsa sp. DLM2.Bin57]